MLSRGHNPPPFDRSTPKLSLTNSSLERLRAIALRHKDARARLYAASIFIGIGIDSIVKV